MGSYRLYADNISSLRCRIKQKLNLAIYNAIFWLQNYGLCFLYTFDTNVKCVQLYLQKTVNNFYKILYYNYSSDSLSENQRTCTSFLCSLTNSWVKSLLLWQNCWHNVTHIIYWKEWQNCAYICLRIKWLLYKNLINMK